MKAATLLLLLGFLPLQLVAVTDCPCGSFCETKNECPDPGSHRSPDDCCSRNRTSSEEAPCFHLEPQSDVDAPIVEAPGVPAAVEIGLVLPLAFTPQHAVVVDARIAGPSPPLRTPPLFLLHAALLI